MIPRTEPASHLKFRRANPPPSATPAATLVLPKNSPAAVIPAAETTRSLEKRLLAASGSAHTSPVVLSAPVIKSIPHPAHCEYTVTRKNPPVQKPLILAAVSTVCPVFPKIPNERKSEKCLLYRRVQLERKTWALKSNSLTGAYCPALNPNQRKRPRPSGAPGDCNSRVVSPKTTRTLVRAAVPGRPSPATIQGFFHGSAARRKASL